MIHFYLLGTIDGATPSAVLDERHGCVYRGGGTNMRVSQFSKHECPGEGGGYEAIRVTKLGRPYDQA